MRVPGVFGTWIALAVVTSITSTMALYKFHGRSSRQPLRSRFPQLTMALGIVCAILLFISCMGGAYGPYIPCGPIWLMCFVLVCASFNVLVAIALALYQAFNITQERMEEFEVIATGGLVLPKSQRKSGTSRHIRASRSTDIFTVAAEHAVMAGTHDWFSAHNCVIAAAVDISLHTFAIVIVLIADPELFSSQNFENCWQRPSHQYLKLILAVKFVPSLIAFIMIATKLKVVVDAFNLKHSLTRIGIVSIAAFVFGCVVQFIMNPIVRHHMSILPTVIFTTIVLREMVYEPLSNSTTQDEAAQFLAETIGEQSSITDKLTRFLLTKTGYDSFKNFLSHEFSVENLLLWTRVRQFREQFQWFLKTTKGSRRALDSIEPIARPTMIWSAEVTTAEMCYEDFRIMAVDIYDEFIAIGAHHEVCISYEIASDYREKIFLRQADLNDDAETSAIPLAEYLTPTLFEPVERACLMLMGHDSLYRFLKRHQQIWDKFEATANEYHIMDTLLSKQKTTTSRTESESGQPSRLVAMVSSNAATEIMQKPSATVRDAAVDDIRLQMQ